MNHINPEEMFRLADGDLEPEERNRFLSHISSCEACKQNFRKTLSFNEEIMNLLKDYQSRSCPDNDTLFMYMEGRIEGALLSSLKSHVETCPACSEKIELADRTLQHIETLEKTRKVTLPSIIKGMKEKLSGLDFNRFVENLERTFVSSKLANELFVLLSKSAEIIKYSLKEPVELYSLAPAQAGAVKYAKSGKGFQKKILSEEGIPFDVEIVQFGERLTLNLRALEKTHDSALLKFAFSEENQMRRQGILELAEGKASVNFSEADIEDMKPENLPLNLSLEVLIKEGTDRSALSPNDVDALFQRLDSLLQSDDPETLEAAVEIVNSIKQLFPESS